MPVNTMIVGWKDGGRLEYLRKLLEGQEGVFWISISGFPPEGFNGASVFTPAQVNAVVTNKELKAAKLVVIDSLTSLQNAFIQAFTAADNAGNPQKKHYGAASWSLLNWLTSIASLGLPMYSLLDLRVDDEKKIDEFFLTANSQAFALPFFPETRYVFSKIQDGKKVHFVQSNNERALRLVSKEATNIEGVN
jgi:hypothetical protein